MEVSARTVVDEETGVVRDIDVSVERRQERVVEHGENLSLHFYVGKLLVAERIFVDDFESEVGVVVVSETTKKDSAEVSGTEMTTELEVMEMEVAIGGESGSSFNGGPMRVPLAVGARVKWKSCSCGGGGGREPGLVEAES